jgi:hypothetical protein
MVELAQYSVSAAISFSFKAANKPSMKVFSGSEARSTSLPDAVKAMCLTRRSVVSPVRWTSPSRSSASMASVMVRGAKPKAVARSAARTGLLRSMWPSILLRANEAPSPAMSLSSVRCERM